MTEDNRTQEISRNPTLSRGTRFSQAAVPVDWIDEFMRDVNIAKAKLNSKLQDSVQTAPPPATANGLSQGQLPPPPPALLEPDNDSCSCCDEIKQLESIHNPLDNTKVTGNFQGMACVNGKHLLLEGKNPFGQEIETVGFGSITICNDTISINGCPADTVPSEHPADDKLRTEFSGLTTLIGSRALTATWRLKYRFQKVTSSLCKYSMATTNDGKLLIRAELVRFHACGGQKEETVEEEDGRRAIATEEAEFDLYRRQASGFYGLCVQARTYVEGLTCPDCWSSCGTENLNVCCQRYCLQYLQGRYPRHHEALIQKAMAEVETYWNTLTGPLMDGGSAFARDFKQNFYRTARRCLQFAVLRELAREREGIYKQFVDAILAGPGRRDEFLPPRRFQAAGPPLSNKFDEAGFEEVDIEVAGVTDQPSTSGFVWNGVDEDPEEEDSWFVGIKKFLFDNVGNAWKMTRDTVGDFLDRAMSYFESIFGGFMLKTESFFSGLKTKLKSILTVISEPLQYAKMKFQEFWKMAKSYIIVIVAVLVVMGLISSNLLWKLVRSVTGVKEEKGSYTACGPEKPTILALGIAAVAVGGLSEKTRKSLTEKLKSMTTIAAGGAVLGTAAMGLLYFLPECLKTAAIRKFGTKTMIADMDAESWIPYALALVKASRIPRVMKGDRYRKSVREKTAEGFALLKKVSPGVRQDVSHLVTSLLKVNVTLEQFANGVTERDIPYGLHIFGEPGSGKSLMLKHFVSDCFDLPSSDLYPRPADAYWNNYQDQKVVVYEEFLATGTRSERYEREAGEYLELVSSNIFQPNMASTDSLSTGVKGTTAEPDVVITINNTSHNRPTCINADAFQRRRRAVIEVKLKGSAKRKTNNNVDLLAYSAEELYKTEWALFRVLPGQWSTEFQHSMGQIPWYNYDELVDYIKQDYAEHKQMCRKVREAFGLKHPEETKGADEILDECLKTSIELPKEGDDFWSVLWQWVKSLNPFAAAVGKSTQKNRQRRIRKKEKKSRSDGDITSDTASTSGDSTVYASAPEELPDEPRRPAEATTFAGFAPPPTPEPPKLMLPKDYGASSTDTSDDSLRTQMNSELEALRAITGNSQVSTQPKVTKTSMERTEQYLQKLKQQVKIEDERLKSMEAFATKEKLDAEKKQKDKLAWEIDRQITQQWRETQEYERKKKADAKFDESMKLQISRRNIGFGETDETKLNYWRDASNCFVRYADINRAIEDGKYNGVDKVEEETWEQTFSGLLPVQEEHVFESGERMPDKYVHYHSCKNACYGCTRIVFHQDTTDKHEELACSGCKAHGLTSIGVPFWDLANPVVITGDTEYTFWQSIKKAYTGFFDKARATIDLIYNHEFVNRNFKDANGQWSSPGFVQKFIRFLTDASAATLAMSATFIGIALVSIAYLLRRIFSSDSKTEEGDTGFYGLFSAASNGPHSRSRSRHGVRDRSWQKGKGRYDAAGPTLDQVDIEIAGVTVHCIPVMDRWVMTYSHWLLDPSIDDGTIMTVKVGTRKVKEKFSYSRVVRDNEADIVFYNLASPQIQQFANASKKFLTLEEMEELSTLHVTAAFEGAHRYGTATKFSNHKISYNKEETRYNPYEVMMIEFPAKKGDCGTAVYAANGKLCGKLIGFIVACSEGSFGSCLATLVCREDIWNATGIKASQATPAEDYTAAGGNGRVDASPEEIDTALKVTGPNKLWSTERPKRSRVPVPAKTKLERSCLERYLPDDCKTTKTPAIMSLADPRCFKDPVITLLENCFATEQKDDLDLEVVDDVYNTIFENYERDLEWPIGKRHLTFVEACKGIPGLLASLKTDTSPGFPRCMEGGKGKKNYFWFDMDGEFHYNLEFEKASNEKYEQFCKGEIPEHIWTGFFKDELVSEEKIANSRTRVIFAGDVDALVALRRIFGALLVAMKSSALKTPSSIGINQFSHDMEGVYGYLTNRIRTHKFVAGDYKSFDMKRQRTFLERSYKVAEKLLGMDHRTSRAVIAHQLDCPIMLKYVEFACKAYMTSGCLLTAVLNCWDNEAYFRYCFAKRFPHLIFDEYCALKVLGDDHILAVSEELDWTGPMIQEDMKAVGQTYTSDVKTDVVIPDFRKFEDITFLGAHPRMVLGKWSGALKKSVLYGSLQWTRNGNLTIREEVVMMLELASQWDKDFYMKYRSDIEKACRSAGIYLPIMLAYTHLRKKVASRVSGSESDFPHFEACGGDKEKGLTTLITKPQLHVVTEKTAAPADDQKHLNVDPSLPMKYGTDSLIFRGSVQWTTNHGAGHILAALSVPGDLLSLGDDGNLQNMPFDRTTYWRGNVETKFQLNGTPFEAGCLCAFFVPLDDSMPDEAVMFCTAYQHVMLVPSLNNTATITIPFNFPTPRIRTADLKTSSKHYSLGTLYLIVYSPLTTGTGGEGDVTVTAFSRFPDSQFTIPAPQTTASTTYEVTRKATKDLPMKFPGRILDQVCVNLRELRENNKGKYKEKMKDLSYASMTKDPEISQKIASGKFTAAGQTTSTTYNISDVSGKVSAETKADPTQSIADGARATAMPMDNPIIGGSSVSTVQKYPSLSQGEGLEPTSVLALRPNELQREHELHIVEREETRISKICAKPTLLVNATWTDQDAAGTVLAQGFLNSGPGPDQNVTVTNPNAPIPLCNSVINLFSYYKGDFIFDILVFRTSFHSGRLKFIVGYGAEEQPTTSEGLFMEVMDFNEETFTRRVRVPYNFMTEFLRTFRGKESPTKKYESMGTWRLEVSNILRRPETVADSVNVYILLSFDELRVAKPYFSYHGALAGPQEGTTDAMAEYSFTAAGPDKDVVEDEEGVVAGSLGEHDRDIPITDTRHKYQDRSPCETRLMEKFPHEVVDLHELYRRNTRVYPFFQDTYFDQPVASRLANPIMVNDVRGSTHRIYKFRFTSRYFHFARLFKMCGGSLKFRIFSKNVLKAYLSTSDLRGAADVGSFYTGIEGGSIEFGNDTVGTSTISSPDTVRYGTSYGALERIFKQNDEGWLDVVLPGVTNFSRVVPDWDTDGKEFSCESFMYMIEYSEDNTEPYPEIYVSMADDFRLSVFAPCRSIRYGYKNGTIELPSTGDPVYPTSVQGHFPAQN